MRQKKKVPMDFETFNKLHQRIIARYGIVVDFQSKEYRLLTMDLIELSQDLPVVSRIVNELVKATVQPHVWEKKLFKLQANLWHTIEHLKSLDETILRLWNDGETNRPHEENVKTRKATTSRSAKTRRSSKRHKRSD
jgi:hypothetical protein